MLRLVAPMCTLSAGATRAKRTNTPRRTARRTARTPAAGVDRGTPPGPTPVRSRREVERWSARPIRWSSDLDRFRHGHDRVGSGAVQGSDGRSTGGRCAQLRAEAQDTVGPGDAREDAGQPNRPADTRPSWLAAAGLHRPGCAAGGLFSSRSPGCGGGGGWLETRPGSGNPGGAGGWSRLEGSHLALVTRKFSSAWLPCWQQQPGLGWAT